MAGLKSWWDQYRRKLARREAVGVARQERRQRGLEALEERGQREPGLEVSEGREPERLEPLVPVPQPWARRVLAAREA